ncbi:hypothetical protein H920_00372 [Fukomys damarensis]|uniref:Uncharacterized protein n=1 Tax=Fukomys damarensis TaxID=885580 RepID=A0A091E1N4_FUKDA|nr:hypothetical protein H920_00372 [Fukomys damarensis]
MAARRSQPRIRPNPRGSGKPTQPRSTQERAIQEPKLQSEDHPIHSIGYLNAGIRVLVSSREKATWWIAEN